MASFHDFSAKTNTGDEQALSDYSGKVLLVVNVASKCGLTPHYEGLQRLQETYGDRGFSVVGFPCNQFLEQEPGTDAEILDFCSTNYGVSFPLFSKIEVNGDGRHPVYEFLTSADSQPDGSGDIAWNFAKFVVGKNGEVVARFAPPTDPLADEVAQAIEKAL